MRKKQLETRITIRFPSELIEKLREIAPENGRSLNGEVVQAVREHIKQQAKKQ